LLKARFGDPPFFPVAIEPFSFSVSAKILPKIDAWRKKKNREIGRGEEELPINRREKINPKADDWQRGLKV
jgi:hypothetical protein